MDEETGTTWCKGGTLLLLVSVMKSAYMKSFDETWPSCDRRKRCPACGEWTLFRHNFPKELARWECCHMEGPNLCGFVELDN